MRLWFTAFAVVVAGAALPAFANDALATSTELSSATSLVRTAADVPAARVATGVARPPTLVHRRTKVALHRAPIKRVDVIQVAYVSSCVRIWCARPFALILGIGY